MKCELIQKKQGIAPTPSLSPSQYKSTDSIDGVRVHPSDAGDGLPPEHVHWVCDAKQHPHPLLVRLIKTTLRDIPTKFECLQRNVLLSSLGPQLGLTSSYFFGYAIPRLS